MPITVGRSASSAISWRRATADARGSRSVPAASAPRCSAYSPATTDVPLELLAEAGAAEGYITAIDILHTAAADRIGRLRHRQSSERGRNVARRRCGRRCRMAISAAARRLGPGAGRLSRVAQPRERRPGDSAASAIILSASCACGGRKSWSRITASWKSASRWPLSPSSW